MSGARRWCVVVDEDEPARAVGAYSLGVPAIVPAALAYRYDDLESALSAARVAALRLCVSLVVREVAS